MNYIDGFVTPVVTADKEKYLQHSRTVAGILKECGATGLVECWGDEVPEGKVTSFPMSVQRKDNETVVLSWISWPSKAAHDAGMKKFMEDPRVKNLEMPFDGKRMIYGGFEVVYDSQA